MGKEIRFSHSDSLSTDHVDIYSDALELMEYYERDKMTISDAILIVGIARIEDILIQDYFHKREKNDK